MTYQEFVDKWNNKGCDFDGYYGFQCMDLAHQYAVEVVEKDFGAAPAAKDVWNQNIDGYDKIENTPTGVPTKGDIIIWGIGVGPYGHIAVFDHGDENAFTSFDQNWPLNSLCHYQNHNYNGVLGWFHPQKNVNEVPPPPLIGLAIDVGYNPDHLGQTVSINGVTYQSYDNNGQLEWKIETDIHSDPPVVEKPLESNPSVSENTVATSTGTVETNTTSTGIVTPSTTVTSQDTIQQIPVKVTKSTPSTNVLQSLFYYLWVWFTRSRKK